MWLGAKCRQVPGAWLVSQVFGCCLVGILQANTVIDWACTYAAVAKVSSCWVCTELPANASKGLPWHIQPMTLANWTWLMGTFPGSAEWKDTERFLMSAVREHRDHMTLQTGSTAWDGDSWIPAEAVELTTTFPICVERLKGTELVGWVPLSFCDRVIVDKEESEMTALPVPRGTLWVCGNDGWPYRPQNWVGRCTWGRPYLPASVQYEMQKRSQNWGAGQTQYRGKHTRGRGALFVPQDSSINVDKQVTALALSTARALNHTHQALSALSEEGYQPQKVVLQQRMALDLLTAAEGGACTLLGTECCVYIPGDHSNVSSTLTHSQEGTSQQQLTGSPLQMWWANLFSWHWLLVVLGMGAFILVAGYCVIYCCKRVYSHWTRGCCCCYCQR